MKSINVFCMLFGFTLASVLTTSLQAQIGLNTFPKLDFKSDWPWWRGPSRDGHAVSQDAPTFLSESKNLVWSTPIPGRGHSSPIVVGDRVYLITADESKQVHSVLAFSRTDGSLVWNRELNRGAFPKKNHPKNTEASPTLACDGQNLFVSLFHHQAISAMSLTLAGEKVWEKKIGAYNPTRFEYGYASSPILYGDYVIFTYEYDGPCALVALSRQDGSEAWRTDRKESITFSSPVVANHEGKDYLLISGGDSVAAYDPMNGKQRWITPGTTMATCGTMVWDSGVVYASGGYPKAETIAIDIATGKSLWKNNQKAYEQSMVAADGHLYSLTDSGVVYCWDGKTGKEKWKQRLAGPVSASGVLVNGKIYWANEAGQLWVFEADPSKYVEVSKNQIGDEAFASPAICGGQVFLRIAKTKGSEREEFLMCFSAKK